MDDRLVALIVALVTALFTGGVQEFRLGNERDVRQHAVEDTAGAFADGDR